MWGFGGEEGSVGRVRENNEGDVLMGSIKHILKRSKTNTHIGYTHAHTAHSIHACTHTGA